jgi:hypothetical protein
VPRPAPRAVASRRQVRDGRAAAERRSEAAGNSMARTFGERPPSPFGGLPISELAILAGIVGLLVGLITGGAPAALVGAIVCSLGVIEVTAREHFSGFRSHAILLAGIPAVIVEAAYGLIFGVPAERPLLLVPLVVVFVPCLVVLRHVFRTARHARVVSPPAP